MNLVEAGAWRWERGSQSPTEFFGLIFSTIESVRGSRSSAYLVEIL